MSKPVSEVRRDPMSAPRYMDIATFMRTPLIDDLSERFAARLRDQGFPETGIDEALALVPLPTMRAVLLGEEKLEIGKFEDYSKSIHRLTTGEMLG